MTFLTPKCIIIAIAITLLITGGIFAMNRLSDTTEEQQSIISNQESTMSDLKLSSSVFEHNGSIPPKYTCDGDDISPPLEISNVGEGVKSLVLIMDDPDAPGGTWDHWVVFNLSPTLTAIEEGFEPKGVSGNNSWGRIGYGGPCPPSGEHRYIFKLYTLDTKLSLKEGATKTEVEKSMQDHIFQQTELIGLYKRQ